MSRFQVILLAVFGFFIVAGLLVFAAYKGSSNSTKTIAVTVWGSLSDKYVSSYFRQLIDATKVDYRITYVQHPEENLYTDYIEAIASGTGPDMLLISQDNLLKYYSKLLIIPFANFPERTYIDTFVSESTMYLGTQGISGIPMSIDPLVMYWNKDIFTNANLLYPPKSWEEFLQLAPPLTQKDSSLNILRSAVALGEYRNINHAKDILSLLTLQAGDPITTRSYDQTSATEKTYVSFGAGLNQSVPPAQAALSFYTQFADPTKQVYTWNRSQMNSKDLFIAGKLGIYFGYASELNEIRNKNPNLNFDISIVPQPQSAQNVQTTKMTYGKMYSLSVARSTKNPAGALQIINFLTSHDAQTLWNQLTGLPSARRDNLIQDPSNPISSVFSSSALISRGWYDPDSVATERIFGDMIENVTSGRLDNSAAVFDASAKLSKLVSQ